MTGGIGSLPNRMASSGSTPMPQTSTESSTAAAPAGRQCSNPTSAAQRAEQADRDAGREDPQAGGHPDARRARATSSSATEPASSCGAAQPGHRAEHADRVAGGDQQGAAGERVRQRVAAQRRAGAARRRTPGRRSTPASGEQQPRRRARRTAAPSQAGPAAQHGEQADARAAPPAPASVAARVAAGRPHRAAAAGALGDRLDDVVVLQLGPLRAGRHQVQHLAVADALREAGPGRSPAASPSVRRSSQPPCCSPSSASPSPACRSTSGSSSASGTCSGSATSTRRCGALIVTRARPLGTVIDGHLHRRRYPWPRAAGAQPYLRDEALYLPWARPAGPGLLDEGDGSA